MKRLIEVAVALVLLLAMVLPAPVAADPAVLHVDDDGVQWPGAYTTINAAIGAASAGDTIIVHEGTYNEQVNVTTAVTITGLGWPVVNATVNAFAISANNATVEGFEINQSTLGGAISVFGANNVTVRHNRVHGAGPFTSWNIPHPWAGISVILCNNVTVEDNYVHDTTGAGIWWGSSTNGTIKNNHVVSTQYTGILLPRWSGNPPSSGNLIEGNTVRSAGNTTWVWDDGIRLGVGAHHNTLQGNHVTGSVLSGIRAVVSTHDNTIQFNTMRGNGGPSGAGYDAHDQSTGIGTAYTANTWLGNKFRTASPSGLQ